jgi:hypothetical protein
VRERVAGSGAATGPGTARHFVEDQDAALRVQQLAAAQLRARPLCFGKNAKLALGFLRAGG